MDTRILKVFGERNTGTRAVIRMISGIEGIGRRIAPLPKGAANPLEAAVENSLSGQWRRLYLHAIRDEVAATRTPDDPWKHAMPRLTPGMIGARVATILMIRDPYSWLTSLARRPYHMKGPAAPTLAAFVARPWMTEAREGLPAVIPSPVELWNRKTGAALDYQTAAFAAGLPCEVVRFEDFVQNPVKTVRGTLETMGLPHVGLASLDSNTKPGEPAPGILREYYAREGWTDDYCAEAIEAVNERLDWSVMAATTYRRRDPSDFPDLLPTDVSARFRSETAALTTPSHREAGTATAA